MNDNVFNLVPGKKAEDGNKLPINQYVVTDLTGEVFPVEGFMIFTSQHIAVMRDYGEGAIPVLVIPLTNLKSAELVEEEDEETELPF